MTQSSKQQFQAYRSNPYDYEKRDHSRFGYRKRTADRPTRRRYSRQYRAWLKPYYWSIAFVFALAVLTAALSLALPVATKYIIDDILMAAEPSAASGQSSSLLGLPTTNPSTTGPSTTDPSTTDPSTTRPSQREPQALTIVQKRSKLMVAGFAVLALTVFSQLVDVLRQWRMAILNIKVIFRLRQKLFDHMLLQPLNELSDIKTGGIVSRLGSDVDNVSGLLQMAVITPGVAAIKVTLTVGYLFYLSWHMALVAAALIPPMMLLNFWWINKVRPIYRALRVARSDLDSRVVESFSGIRVVRIFQREKKESLDYGVGQHLVNRMKLRAEALQLVVTSGWGLLIPLASLVIIWYGGMRYLADAVQIGGILAFQMCLLMLLQPVSQIVISYGTTQQAFASLERVFEILNRSVDKPDPVGAIAAPQPVSLIEFDHVVFRYRDDIEVLKGLTLKVRAGLTVALVGPSGAGKTTVTNLIARFYDPTSGAIRLNGVDLRNIRLDSYRELLGMVEQDVFLFDGTIRDNIGYGCRGTADDQVRAAAVRANAAEFIERLPEGYDSLIGERGVKLSGGQRQRLSIARAILADPQILILDEATSNLDTESEQLIQASLADLFAHRTTFVIAHRLSTIISADLIVVMKDGCIVETGDHDDLMQRGGLYFEMVSRQMKLQTDTANLLNWNG